MADAGKAIQTALERLQARDLAGADTTPPKKKVFCFSDTHIGMKAFGKDISASKREAQIIQHGLEEADEAWLLGDIFEVILTKDEVWEDKHLKEIFFEEAKKYLRLWNDINPNCVKKIVWGNHEEASVINDDSLKLHARSCEFIEEIERCIKDEDLNYKISTNGYVAIGDVVGVHGHQGRAKGDYMPPDWFNELFIWLGRALNTSWNSRFNDPEKWVKQIYKWLAEKFPDTLATTRHIVFGHIHNPFLEKSFNVDGAEGEQVKFSNTGVSLWLRQGLFNPIMFETDGKTASNFRSYREVLKERGVIGTLRATTNVQEVYLP